jgi:hypothetical protein
VEAVALVRRVIRLATKMSDRLVSGATNQHYILCEIRKECKWHLCNGFRGLWAEAVKELILNSINRFKEGREHVEDDGISGRQRSHRTDENIEKVRNFIHSD